MPNLYGLLISLSILCCILVAHSLIKNEDEETFWGVAFWTIVSGIIGARLYHVLSNLQFYLSNPLGIFEVWNGGLGIWGAITGGVTGAIIFLKNKGQEILYWLDLMAVVVPLGQAIGRWGNFFNQELFGKPTALPWGIFVSPQNRPAQFATFQNFHPLFLYESVFDLILFGILFLSFVCRVPQTGEVTQKKYREKFPAGIFTALYIGGYSIIRFFLEYLRINPWTIAGLNVSQCVSILALAFSIVFITKKIQAAEYRRKNDLHIF